MYHPINATVYGPAAAPLAYIALDLTTWVGANEVLCFFDVKSAAGAKHSLAFKPGDSGGPDPHPESWDRLTSNNAQGCGAVEVDDIIPSDENGVVVMMTDPLGFVRWIADNNAQIEVVLRGYMDITPVWGAAALSGVVPLIWTAESLIPEIGAIDSLVFLKNKRTANGWTHHVARTTGLAGDYDDNKGGDSVVYHPSVANLTYGTLVQTAAGFFDRIAGGAVSLDVFVGGYSPTWHSEISNPSNPIYPSAAKAAAWEVIDFSAIVSTETVTKVQIENTGGVSSIVGFRPVGSGDVYALSTAKGHGCWSTLVAAGKCKTVTLITDSSGQVEWYSSGSTVELTVLGQDNVPPVVTGTGPVGTVAPNADVEFTTTDDVQVDTTSLRLHLTDPDLNVLVALTGGAWQAGYGGSIVANGSNGFDVKLATHPPFAVGVWSAEGYCTDVPGLSDTDTWGWTVAADSPTVTLQSPLGATTDLVRIGCRCLDDWGFDLTTLSLTAKPSDSRPGDVLTAISAGAIQAGWAGVITPSVGNPTVLDIVLTSWPAALDAVFPSKLWTFTVSCDTIVGTSL